MKILPGLGSQDNIISSLCFMLFSDSILQISSALKISSAGPSSAVHLETPAWHFHVTKHNTESALRVFQHKPDAVFLYLSAHSQSCTAVRDVQLYQISLQKDQFSRSLKNCFSCLGVRIHPACLPGGEPASQVNKLSKAFH